MQTEKLTTLDERILEGDRFSSCPTWDTQAQATKNQVALKRLAAWKQECQTMSDEESEQRENFFKDFQHQIDAQRPQGAKLYLE